MAIQWHPLFAFLLRPLVEGHFEVVTNVPVGDAPRAADLVLLRRKQTGSESAFHGVWRHLTKWNILEYKGPTVSARLEDIDLLVELGLGIHRRLNSEGAKNNQKSAGPTEVSFGYLASKLGKRFLNKASGKAGNLATVGPGIWRVSVLERPMFLVSGVDLPVEADSVPFHVLAVESHEKELAAARLILNQPELWDLYSQFLATLHPQVLRELNAMARTSSKGPKFHLKPLVDLIGMDEAIDQLGANELIACLASRAKQKKKLVTALLSEMTQEERAEIKRQLNQDSGG